MLDPLPDEVDVEVDEGEESDEVVLVEELVDELDEAEEPERLSVA